MEEQSERFKRVFLIILDSLGVGALPDAVDYGDDGSNTLKSVVSTGLCNLTTLTALGLSKISGIDYISDVSKAVESRLESAYGKMAELSRGKDTTTGHWEIAGCVSEHPFPTYPYGFPDDIIDEFIRLTGRGILCNRPYSGTQVIADYGEEQLRTGKLIVYTSADSVFQIAAHEDMISREQLYEYCKIARRLLTGKHAVGRVIARPFNGVYPFKRTSGRHDFSLEPPCRTLCDLMSDKGFDMIAVGKIGDIFAHRGFTRELPTISNDDGMEKTEKFADENFNGLCFVNLVEFDSLYGHRNDAPGYASALETFDRWLQTFLGKLRRGDLLIITADHGCDPITPSTDHSREYVPLLV